MRLYRARLDCLSLAGTWLPVTIYVHAESEEDAWVTAGMYFIRTVREKERGRLMELEEIQQRRSA